MTGPIYWKNLSPRVTPTLASSFSFVALLCHRRTALPFYPSPVIVSLLCHRRAALSSSFCFVIFPLRCHHPFALSSSPRFVFVPLPYHHPLLCCSFPALFSSPLLLFSSPFPSSTSSIIFSTLLPSPLPPLCHRPSVPLQYSSSHCSVIVPLCHLPNALSSSSCPAMVVCSVIVSLLRHRSLHCYRRCALSSPACSL